MVWSCALSALAQPAPPPPAAPAPAASSKPETSVPSALAEAPPLPADAPMVLSVELLLPEGVDRTGLDELVSLQPGQLLSRRAARETIERLMATRRFGDVVVRARPEPAGVRVTLELVPQPKLVALATEGNRVLTREEVLEAARLGVGQDFYPERLPGVVHAVEAAYRRRGYDDAQVTAEPFGQGEVSLVLHVDEGAPTRVIEVTAAGSPGLPLEQVLEEVGLGVGDVLDRRALEAGLERLRALYRRERYYAARVGEPLVLPGADGARLALPLSAGPRFDFHFHGNRRFSDSVLRTALRYDGTETLDDSTVGRLARRLESFYRYHGFHGVRVTPRVVTRPDEAEAVLVFTLEEGQMVRVERVEIVGNKEIPSEELLQHVVLQILNREPEEHGDVRMRRDPLELQGRSMARPGLEPDEPEPEPGTVLIEEAYRDAADAMTAEYRQRGFATAHVRYLGASIDVEGRTAQVRFEVHEGTRAKVRQVFFEGAPPSFDAATVAGLVPGAPLSGSAAENSRTALVRALGRAGYLFATVTLETVTEREGAVADLRYRIEPGPQVRLGRVIFQGLDRTDERLLRAALKLRASTVLDPQDLADTQRTLVQLGIFRQVEVRLIEPERVETVKDVVIAVKERARLVGEVSGGYFLNDGPRLIGDVVLSNIAGQGVNASVRVKANYVGASAQSLRTDSLQGLEGLGLRGNVAVQQPRLLFLLPFAEVGARVDLIGERVIRQVASYRFDRFAAVAGVDWTLTRWLNASLQYEIESVQVRLLSPRGLTELLTSLARADQERLRFPFGVFGLSNWRPALTMDLRDDPVNPRSGALLSATAEVTRDLYTQLTEPNGTPLLDAQGNPRRLPINTLKLSGSVTGYVPLTERIILALSVRGGRILPLGEGRSQSKSQTIPPKRFFLGGSTTLRGFREDGTIPQDRREEVDAEVIACRQLANPAGCTAAAQVVAAGLELPSEGGDLFVLAKAELRFPIARSIDVGTFVEAGNLWLSPSELALHKLRYVAGVGLRYGTPIGPLAFDVGFNLLPDEKLNEPLFNVNFSIGIF